MWTASSKQAKASASLGSAAGVSDATLMVARWLSDRADHVDPVQSARQRDTLAHALPSTSGSATLLSDFERSVYRVGGAEAFADEVASTAREWQATGRLTPAVISETGREHVAGDNTASEMTSASPLPACGASISDRPEARAPGPSDISYGVLPQNTEHDARLALC